MSGKARDLKDQIARVASGQSLSRADAEQAFDIIMSGDATPSQMGGFLMALRVRGETVEEITGAATVMRAKMTTIERPDGAIDICGTGGDGSGTYNISTASQFVVAACGVPVAKHGNRAASSKSGASDVLEALGVNIDADMRLVERALAEVGTCFLMAQRHHSAMRHVGPTRVELGTRTLFNLLGPLSNPAKVRRQLIGVFAPEWIVPLAEVLRELGHERAWVVHGAGGLDEVSTLGPTQVAELKDGKVTTFEVSPADAGLPTANLEQLVGGDRDHNSAKLKALLSGEAGPYRDIVVLGSAAALIVAGKAETLEEGAALAVQAIDSGKAQQALEGLVRVTNEEVPA
ncbi:anthranilate phosphoribosyltransferase [Pelagibius litoralis]|uniref:Anthranilate phosphoribosyltransferase n=1 Tax=Pelagibius litoralis TaxID=374515 RepID=A0A967C2T2_9PROT|nr:anthranilate phosphoribosyltransferase [Pelagibius litoralis]NIA67315.1 anthranilate phosphoribosyltransferase [Pelagibius litoralis]